MDSEEKKALQEKIFRHLNTRVSEAAQGVRKSSRDLLRQIEELSDELGRRVEEGSAEAVATMVSELSGARDAATRAEERCSGLARGVISILEQKDQLSVLEALLEGALRFTDGAVIFVLKDDNIGGWRSGGRIGAQQAKGVHFPFVTDNSVVRSLRQRDVVCVTGELSRSDSSLFENLGAGQPSGFVAVPLLIRGRAQAVLLGAHFAETGAAPGRTELEACKALAAAAMSAIRNIQGQPRREPRKRPAAAPRRDRVAPKPARPAPRVPPAPVAEPPVKKTEVPTPPRKERPRKEIRPKPIPPVPPVPPAVPAETAAKPASPKPPEKPRSPWFTPTTRNSSFGSKGAKVEVPPRGLGLRNSRTEDTDEKPLSVEERELHDDARRFARLLVSEIKLYNEDKVVAGRQEKDLYQRLRSDIERSRQMYNERVPPSIAAKTNYFMDELVSILAEGDRATLGM
jgi:hypothetical protein